MMNEGDALMGEKIRMQQQKQHLSSLRLSLSLRASNGTQRFADWDQVSMCTHEIDCMCLGVACVSDLGFVFSRNQQEAH